MKIRIAIIILSAFFLTMCASVNSRLITKTDEGDVPAMGTLIDKGADVNYRESNLKDKYFGQIPLTVAVKNQNLEAVKFLLSRGADVNAEECDRQGDSPLHVAVKGKNIEIAQLLIKSGADVDARNKEKYTPLYFALLNNNLDMAKLLVKSKADVNVKVGEIEGPVLLELTMYKKVEGVKFVLANGASVNALDKNGRNALYWATSEEMVDLLISKGININVKNKEGKTPLLYNLEGSGTYVAIHLIKKGASLGVNDPDGRTVLHMAVTKGNLELVEAIVEKKANVNAKDKNGRTPLHYLYLEVVKSGNGEGDNLSIGRCLKNRGARLDAEDINGKTPSSFAFDFIMGEADAGLNRSRNYRSRDAFDATGSMMALGSMGDMRKRREVLDKFENELSGSSEYESE